MSLNPDWPVFENTGEDENVDEIILDVRNHDAGPITDRTGREYDYVGKFLENDDFYQGLNMITLIRRKSDNALFGYSWWDDISKHGESYIESNGDNYGLECDTSADDFDWDTDYVSYFVWEPVEEYPIKAYKKVGNE
jgi:hypothetical protein